MAGGTGSLEGFHPSQLFNDNYMPEPGEAVIVLHPRQEQVLSRCTMAVFSILDKRTDRPVYQGLTFIAPPTKVWPYDEEETLGLLLTGLRELTGNVNVEVATWLKSRFTFLRCASLDTESILNELQTIDEKQFVFLPSATLYKLVDVHSSPLSRGRLGLDEDTWVPQLAQLAEKAIKFAKQKRSYLLMTGSNEAPLKNASTTRLLGIEGLSFAAYRDSEYDKTLSRIARLAALAASGRAQEAMDRLEVETLSELVKKQARVQIAHHSGNSEVAAQFIRELLEEISVADTTAARWAVICLKGGDRETASKLLELALGQVSDGDLLNSMLQMATQLRRSDLVKLARERLSDLFPGHEALRLDCELRLLQICAWERSRAESLSTTRIDFAEHHELLARKLSPGAELDYRQILDDFNARWPEHGELALMCAATHAEASGNAVDAMVLAIDLIPESRFSPAAARLLLRVMRQLFLADEVERSELDIYRLPVAGVIAHLAHDPSDGELRSLLVRSLSVESSGGIGLAVLVAVTIDLAKDVPLPAPEPTIPEPVTQQGFKEFLHRLEEWMGSFSLLDPRMHLPPDVVGSNAAGLARYLQESLEAEVLEQQSSVDLEGLDFPAHLLPMITRHVPGGSDDIHALRVLAGRHVLFGNHQRARDLAEQILQIADDSDQRKRLAWGAYADAYLRTRSYPDALLGLACAASSGAQLPAADLYLEVYALHRLTRDLGFTEIAKSVLDSCRALYASLGMNESMRHRLDVVELSSRLSTVRAKDLPALELLLRDCQSAVEDAFRLKDELSVAAFLFAQVAGKFERAGGQISIEAKSLIAKVLDAVGTETATYLRTVANSKPTPSDIVLLHNRMAGARYSADAPSDAVAVNIAAHRLLCQTSPELSPQDAFLAIELLADRGLTLSTASAALTADWPLQYAKTLVERGVAILMLALDDEGELVAAIADSADAYVLRPANSTLPALNRLREWSSRYPRGYGFIEPRKKVIDERSRRERETGDKEFYDSMRHFEIPMPRDKRVLVIAEPEVARLTFNLVVRNGDLIGYDAALGIVPSLTWLEAIQKKTAGRDGRRLAWISSGSGTAELEAMEVVKVMIQDTLAAHDFVLDTSDSLPQGFQDAQMAIVTAHGQLTADDRYIHRIRDEGDLQESPTSLALALAGVELVVLFVCSGGRVDTHPMNSTTVGLPKLLLDRGCRTVIASPWPLESLAPGTWLPAFLQAWERGDTAMDACHQANLQIAMRREHEPQVSLAMSVYGDALLTRARP